MYSKEELRKQHEINTRRADIFRKMGHHITPGPNAQPYAIQLDKLEAGILDMETTKMAAEPDHQTFFMKIREMIKSRF